MDRAAAVSWSERAGASHESGDAYLPPTRAEALAGLRSALGAGRGPVLLTGEPGIGKTYLCRRLKGAMPTHWRWACLDLSPVISEPQFYQLLLHAMGCDPTAGPAEARSSIADALALGAEDGEHWALVVDEAHNASRGVLEELRVLGNRLGESGAFGGVLLVGQTGLAGRLNTRPFASLQARISARIHLRPILVEELCAWLSRLDPGRAWDPSSVERLHQETAGNPSRLLSRPFPRSAEPATTRQSVPSRVAHELIAPRPDVPTAVPRLTGWDAPPVGPSKPPLRFGEGMIEVGWEPTDEPDRVPDVALVREPKAETVPALQVPTVQASRPAPAEEVVDDHYAALQAWTEWSRNQGRHDAEEGVETHAFAGDLRTGLDPDENPAARVIGGPGVRVEGQQEFAPYSQLFSRLRQTHEG